MAITLKYIDFSQSVISSLCVLLLLLTSLFTCLVKITTREDVNAKQAASIKSDLEPEAFRPNLSDPSQLLQTDQIEKVGYSYFSGTSICFILQSSFAIEIEL